MKTSNVPRKAVCLFSGGLDSTTTLYYALNQGFQVTALTMFYGQVHEKEIECSREIVRRTGIDQQILSFSLPWGGSSLLASAAEIPVNRNEAEMTREIPSTYVPGRNIIFLSFAISLAEVLRADSLFLGVNAIDYSGYPDCRPAFLDAFSTAANLGTREGVSGRQFSIEAPLLRLSKKEIIELGSSLHVPFELTWSCYRGGRIPCGICDSCILRKKGFEEAGIRDPLVSHEKSAHG